MIYYENEEVVIRTMSPSDAEIITRKKLLRDGRQVLKIRKPPER